MQTNTKNRVYAGFFVRLAAFLVDLLIVNTGLLLIRVPMGILSMSNPNNILVKDFIFQYSVVDIVIYLATVAYFILQTYYSGATIGKKMFQIRVVSTQERKMTFFEVAYRETIGRFLAAVVANLGYLLIFVDKEKRGVHDILSDTHVVYYHEKRVYVHAPVYERNMNQPSNVPPMGTGMNPPNVPPMGTGMNPPNVAPMGTGMNPPNVPLTGVDSQYLRGEQKTLETPYTKVPEQNAEEKISEMPFSNKVDGKEKIQEEEKTVDTME